MRIRLLVDIQGFGVKGDGTHFEWPGRGGEIDLDDQTAVDMVNQGVAVPVTTFGQHETATPSTIADEERGMGTAARTIARPGHPTIAREQSFEVGQEPGAWDEVAEVKDQASVEVTPAVSAPEAARPAEEESQVEQPSEQAAPKTQPRRGRPPRWS